MNYFELLPITELTNINSCIQSAKMKFNSLKETQIIKNLKC